MQFNPVKSLRSFYSNSLHILSVSYRPDVKTFTRTVKVVLLGTLLLGVLGFIISLIISFVAG